jgi:hypothetical protein
MCSSSKQKQSTIWKDEGAFFFQTSERMNEWMNEHYEDYEQRQHEPHRRIRPPKTGMKNALFFGEAESLVPTHT